MKLANAYPVIAAIVIILSVAILISFIDFKQDEEYSIEFLTPKTIKVTGYVHLAMKELREKYVIKNFKPIYGNPKRRFTATEYIVTIEPESPQ